MSTVEVQLFKRKNNTGYIKVRLRSEMKAGIISYKDIDLDSVNSESDMERAVNIAGGALAEYQIQRYEDKHDPSECAKLAVEAFKEMWAELKQRGG